MDIDPEEEAWLLSQIKLAEEKRAWLENELGEGACGTAHRPAHANMDHEPLMEPSLVDMHTDAHPPTGFTRQEWATVRDGLHTAGKPFKANKADARRALFRAALAMNLTQENYKHQLSVVGQQGGRLFAERACHFILGRRPQKKADGKEETLNERIQQLGAAGFGALIDDMHALRMFGNRVDHDDLPDLRPNEKPDVVHRVYRIAVAMLQLARARNPPTEQDARNWTEEQACACMHEFAATMLRPFV